MEPKTKYWNANHALFKEVREEIKKRIIAEKREERIEIFNDCLFTLFAENLDFLEHEVSNYAHKISDIIAQLNVRLNYLNQKSLEIKNKIEKI
jgi:hypothetical protein